MKLTLQIFGKALSVAINEPEPAEHKCPTREEDFARWKANNSSGTNFGFAPRKQDFVNANRRPGRWEV